MPRTSSVGVLGSLATHEAQGSDPQGVSLENGLEGSSAK